MQIQKTGHFSSRTIYFSNIKKQAEANTRTTACNSDILEALSIQSANNAPIINQNQIQEEIDIITKNIQEKFDEITQEMQDIYSEVTHLYKKGDKTAPDGSFLRIITGDNKQKTMEEYTQDGRLTRKTTFTKINGGLLCSVEEGCEILPNGSKKIAKKALFWHNQPISFIQDHQIMPDGSEKFKKRVGFRFAKPVYFVEDYKKLKDGTLERAEEVEYSFGKISYYLKGFKGQKDGSFEQEKEIHFKDGQAILYQNGLSRNENGVLSAQKTFKKTKNGWQEIRNKF